MKRILVIHTFGMGDMIMALPLISQLKIEYPSAQIDIFYTDKAALFPIKNNPYVSNIYFFKPSAYSIIKSLLFLRNQKYDVSLVTSISFRSCVLKNALFSYLVHASARIGEYKTKSSVFYTHSIKFSVEKHRVISNMSLLGLYTGKTYTASKPQLFINEDSYLFTKMFLKKTNIVNQIMTIHPGCNKKNKHRRWPVKQFVKLITLLQDNRPQLKIIIIAGPDEIHEATEISKKTHTILVKNQPLDHIAALISKSDFFLNTDSGLGHIAACFNTKIFTIFGPGDERKTKPFSEKAVVIRKDIECSPCLQSTKQCGIRCLHELRADDVFNKILDNFKEI